MTWKINGTPDTLTGTAALVEITDLTAKKFNMFMSYTIESGSTSIGYRFNANTNSVYSRRVSLNGLSDSTEVSQTRINGNNGGVAQLTIMYVMSISGEEKLVIAQNCNQGPAGASNAPSRMEITGKFVPSPDADITQASVNEVGSGDWATDSNLSALGDIDIILPIQRFDSLYESFQALTSVQVSHFVEWFSGDALDSIWTTRKNASGTFLMADSIDGGFEIVNPNSANSDSRIDFNVKRHYDPADSIIIYVIKSSSDSNFTRAVGGLENIDIQLVNAALAGLDTGVSATKFFLGTGDNSSASATVGSVDNDTLFHVFKIECGSANIKLYIDGVLDITKTTNRPTLKMQPFFEGQSFNSTGARTLSIRYLEVFNTSISILSTLYERLSALTQVMGQRVVDTFSGALLNERWNQSGAGTNAMADEIDGGVLLESTSTSFSNSTISFNTKRQYNFDDTVILIVAKINSLTLALMKLGLANIEGFFTDSAHLEYDSGAGTFYGLRTGDNSTVSTTASDVTADTNYHLFKIECGSANIKLYIDGVLKVTKTTNRPTLKMMPDLRSLTRTTAVKSVNVLYCEAYNKLSTETDYPSVYELFQELTTITKQHFWEWFDGNDKSNRWVTGTSSGGGTVSMADSIDGGLQLVTNSSIFDEVNIGFGTFAGTGVRQFEPTGSIIIFTLKSSRSTNAGIHSGLWNDNTTGERSFLGMQTNLDSSNYILQTGDASTESTTSTTVSLDTNFHVFKIENGSADIKATVDGVLEVTKTTNRPTVKLEPFVECLTRTGSAVTANIGFMEIKNT